MRKEVIFLIVLAFVLLSLPIVSADRAMISPPNIKVYEPGQKAIVAWNGNTEVLILSTDVYASENNTTALEVLPLPSKPSVELGNISAFTKINQLVGSKTQAADLWGYGFGGARGGIDIVFQERIGAHNVTVIYIKDFDDFDGWVKDFLKGKAEIPSGLNSIVSTYLEDEIRYFVFDLVELNKSKRSIEPLVYTFASSYLYYPLLISSMNNEGKTELAKITLVTITPFDIQESKITGLGFRKSAKISVDKKELNGIDKRIGDIINGNGDLRVFEYYGYLETFDSDIKAKRDYIVYYFLWTGIVVSLSVIFAVWYLVVYRK